jgi:1A family penicillin-binding protein
LQRFDVLKRRAIAGAALGLAVCAVLLNLVVFLWVARYTFAVRGLRLGLGDTMFHDRRGRPWFPMDEQRHEVPLAQISPHLRNAAVAIEDHRFYHHSGIDAIAVARALLRNVRSGEVVEGGSTITQQLARTVFLSNKRTWGRKLKEAALAWLIEEQLPKDRILELYLNRVYLGAGAYGVDSMSRKLYGKPASALTLSEAALIAGLIRAPSALSPWSNPDGALARERVVLHAMLQHGMIAAGAERAAAAAAPLIQPYYVASGSRAGYAKELLRQQFRERFGGDHPPDWHVDTTFLPELQDAAERAVARGLARYRPGLEAALVALDPETGDLLALVGGRDFHSSPFNRALKSRRQPGSAFKPFVFAAALDRGYSPVSLLEDLNSVAADGPEEWRPVNAHGEAQDQLTLRAALEESNNRAAVALQQKIGSGPVLKLASAAGLRGLPDVPSLALGTGEVTPLDLTLAFAAFANGGFKVEPRAILQVVDAQGSIALDHEVHRTRVLPEEVAFQMVSMLEDVLARGTGAEARALGVTFPAAGKTGTTDDFKDAWFVGFTRSLVVGVWVGFDQPASIGQNAYGARVALPIWADFMTHAARVVPPGQFQPPEDMRAEPLCRISYLRPMQECPTYTEYFKPDDRVPSELCPLHGGPLKQRAARAVEGFFSGLGKKLKGLFGGR